MTSIISNYSVLHELWDSKLLVIGYLYTHRNEGSNPWSTSTHAAIRALFGLVLGHNLLQHTDSLSVCLQRKSLSAAEGQALAAMTIRTL